MSKVRTRKTKEIVTVSKNINGKGKLKGKNKQETKVLKGICPHHRINKKGKIVPAIKPIDQKTLGCTMCRDTFPAKFFKQDYVNEVVDQMKEINNQNKFTATAINAGEKTVSLFSQMGVMLISYPKISKKVMRVADKSGKLRNNKNKRKNNQTGSSMYGTWGNKN